MMWISKEDLAEIRDHLRSYESALDNVLYRNYNTRDDLKRCRKLLDRLDSLGTYGEALATITTQLNARWDNELSEAALEMIEKEAAQLWFERGYGNVEFKASLTNEGLLELSIVEE